jgi:hypothetical protein
MKREKTIRKEEREGKREAVVASGVYQAEGGRPKSQE